MKYTLLKNVYKGFMLTRKPGMVDKELIITFSGAPSGATAIFENADGNSLYRLLADKTCSVPADFLVNGEIKVTVTLLNGRADAEKFTCEPICVERKNGVILVYPNWLDLPMQIIEIYGEIQKIKNEMAELKARQTQTEEKLAQFEDEGVPLLAEEEEN